MSLLNVSLPCYLAGVLKYLHIGPGSTRKFLIEPSAMFVVLIYSHCNMQYFCRFSHKYTYYLNIDM